MLPHRDSQISGWGGGGGCRSWWVQATLSSVSFHLPSVCWHWVLGTPHPLAPTCLPSLSISWCEQTPCQETLLRPQDPSLSAADAVLSGPPGLCQAHLLQGAPPLSSLRVLSLFIAPALSSALCHAGFALLFTRFERLSGLCECRVSSLWERWNALNPCCASQKLAQRCLHLCVLSHFSSVSDSLWPQGLQPARLLCPWDSPGRNTGVGCRARLQDLPSPGIEPASSALAGRFFTTSATCCPHSRDLQVIDQLITCQSALPGLLPSPRPPCYWLMKGPWTWHLSFGHFL